MQLWTYLVEWICMQHNYLRKIPIFRYHRMSRLHTCLCDWQLVLHAHFWSTSCMLLFCSLPFSLSHLNLTFVLIHFSYFYLVFFRIAYRNTPPPSRLDKQSDGLAISRPNMYRNLSLFVSCYDEDKWSTHRNSDVLCITLLLISLNGFFF